MAITYSNQGSAGSAVAVDNFSPNPAAQVNGDLFVVHICLGDSTRVVTPPSGWEVGYNVDEQAGSQQAIFYKVVDGTEPEPFVFSWTGGTTTHASICVRATSSIGTIVVDQFAVSVDLTDNSASYTTSAMTFAGGAAMYGGAGEGTSASVTWSQAHGDTELADVTSGTGTGESNAAYRSSGTHSGSTTKTMSPSVADRFACTQWLAEVSEAALPSPSIPGRITGTMT